MAAISDTPAAGSSTPHTGTGLTDSTHSSTSSSAERYHLEETDKSSVLVYRYRGGGLHFSSQHDLCGMLDKDERLRCTKIPIQRGESYVDVQQHNLYLPEEHAMYKKFPSYYQSLASIRIPTKAYLSRMIFGNYDTLYIVSPQSSPESSVADPTSRSNTWSKEDFDEHEESKPATRTTL